MLCRQFLPYSKLSADSDTALSHGPHCNVWHELQSLLKTSKMGLRKRGNKYFIRLGWENIDCPKTCHCISWSSHPLSTNCLPYILRQAKGISSDFTEQPNVLLALKTGILFLKCDLVGVFQINSSITRWGESWVSVKQCTDRHSYKLL